LRHEIQSHRVTVTRQLADEAPKVLGDRIQFQQVIVNLTVNAIQAIEHAQSTQREINIGVTVLDAVKLRCTVEDSGPGIAHEHLDSLFESFFTTKENGMGMGLPICRSIIKAHGGHFSADNESDDRLSFLIPFGVR
jgi:signal transduction histidine kinase